MQHCNLCSTLTQLKTMPMAEGTIDVCKACEPFVRIMLEKPLPITIKDF